MNCSYHIIFKYIVFVPSNYVSVINFDAAYPLIFVMNLIMCHRMYYYFELIKFEF